MIPAPSQAEAAATFTAPLLEKLRRHPKRIVFTDGEDRRVLRVAARLVAEEAATPILLGSRDRIRSLADEIGVELKFINVLEPAESTDLKLFCDRFVKMKRYQQTAINNPEELMARPNYFGGMMIQYGQADALVGGNKSLPAALFRALINTVKPQDRVPKVFGATILSAPHLNHFGQDGLLVFADCGLVPQPKTDQLVSIAIESGKLARHFLGRPVRVAMLSHSTKGSALTDQARIVQAATALAQAKAKEEYLEIDIDGEVQADVALDPLAAEVKLPDSQVRLPADVLVFPNLDAAHTSLKLLQHCAGAMNFGQFLLGLSRPAAQVPRTSTEETIFGTAAAVAVEAIKFHENFPDSDF